MQKISRSVRKPKHRKMLKRGMTVQSVQCHCVASRLTVQAVQLTWQPLEMTCGRLMWCTGRQLDQSMGDTCHHCKGDTWQHADNAVDDVAAADRAVTWAGTVTGKTCGPLSDPDNSGKIYSVVDVPCGPVMGCHVAPCGWLKWFCAKIVWGSPWVEPPTYSPGNGLAGLGLTTQHHGWFLLMTYDKPNISELNMIASFCWMAERAGA